MPILSSTRNRVLSQGRSDGLARMTTPVSTSDLQQACPTAYGLSLDRGDKAWQVLGSAGGNASPSTTPCLVPVIYACTYACMCLQTTVC